MRVVRGGIRRNTARSRSRSTIARIEMNDNKQVTSPFIGNQTQPLERPPPHTTLSTLHCQFATPARVLAIRPCRRHRRILAQLSYPYRPPGLDNNRVQVPTRPHAAYGGANGVDSRPLSTCLARRNYAKQYGGYYRSNR